MIDYEKLLNYVSDKVIEKHKTCLTDDFDNGYFYSMKELQELLLKNEFKKTVDKLHTFRFDLREIIIDYEKIKKIVYEQALDNELWFVPTFGENEKLVLSLKKLQNALMDIHRLIGYEYD